MGALPFVGAGQTKQPSPQKGADQQIRSAPSIDSRYSTTTSYKSDTPVSGGAYQDIRKVTTEWNARLKHCSPPKIRGSMHPASPSTLFFPIFSLAREKIGPPEARQKRPRRNEALHARLLILCARFFLSKPQTEFAVWAFPCRSATTSQPASLTAPLEGEPRGAHCRRHRAVANLQQPLSLGCAEPAPLEGEPFVWLRGPPLRRGLRPSWGWRAQRRGG